MARINQVDHKEATGEVKELLDSVKSKYGAVPNLLATVAHAPSVLKGYLQFSQALSGGVLNDETREAIALTLARINECDYCESAHAFASSGLNVSASEIRRRLDGHSADARIQAILIFTRAVVDKQGQVSDQDLVELRAVGISDTELAEIIGIIVANIFTNYFNHVAETENDFPNVALILERAA